jgi:2-C-methyl-D-erythritol 2,4-cyclodiphosphate synthase
MKAGIGTDIHKLAKGRKLILGGVEIPFDKGLLGHSDADVLIHAVCDAILGAAALGDIGLHFPDTDENFKGISSLKLLSKVNEMIRKKGCFILNIDSTVIAQIPKLAPFRKEMESNIANALGINENLVNVKFKTAEGLGFIGKGEGIMAECVVMMRSRKDRYAD